MITKILLLINAILLTILLSLLLYFYIKLKIFAKKNNGSYSLSKFYEEYHTDNTDTPKSISSMEPIDMPDIQKDYPNLNINELKSNAEKAILSILMSIENHNLSLIQGYNPKILEFTRSKMKDNKNTKYENIKFHRTAINRYIKEKNTIIFITTLEYNQVIRNNSKKVQARIKTEYTYNKDRTNKYLYKLNLNCPNCGATITDEEHRKCSYCGATALNIDVSPWRLNNIKED